MMRLGLHRDKDKNKEKGKEGDQSKKDLEEKGLIVDLLVHDLRGPLAVIATSASNLIQKPERYGPLNESQDLALQRILRNTRKAQTLLQDMIELFRSEEGFFQEDYFTIDETFKESLMEVLEAILPQEAEKLCQLENNKEDYEAFLKTQGIFYEIKGKYCRTPFCHDQKKIQQILRNLISNALKYRRARMKISIRGSRDLYLRVEDDGLGIPSHGQQAVFERFVRLTNKETAHIPGLGLGLAGVKTLVKAMGGEITLISREGLGTRFLVRIPPLNLRKEDYMVSDSILNGKRILAVDDEPDVLEVLEEEILDACPDSLIDKATSYEKAVELLNSWTYDIVILDIMGVRGFDLLALAKTKNYPVAMLTAHALSAEALKRSIEMGARAYLPKEKLGEIVPFLEDIMEYEAPAGWNRLFDKLGGFFDNRFGSDWRRSDQKFWNEFKQDVGGRFDRVIIK